MKLKNYLLAALCIGFLNLAFSPSKRGPIMNDQPLLHRSKPDSSSWGMAAISRSLASTRSEETHQKSTRDLQTIESLLALYENP